MPTFTSFDGLELSYTVRDGDGTRRRPVVLLHGFAADAAVNWAATGVVKALGDAGFTVILPDARGHGASAKPHDEASYGDDALAHDVSALLDELGLDDVALVGYSMGAIIALTATARDPRIRCLATGGVGSGVVDFGGVDTRVVKTAEISEALLTSDVSTIPPSALPFRLLADTTGADRQALAALVRSSDTNTPADLTAIGVPTLVLAGDQDPLAAEPERLAAAIAGARLVRVPGDHLTAVVSPSFASALVSFLATTPSDPVRV